MAQKKKSPVVVDPARLGRQVGLRRGDVIEAINDVEVVHPDDVIRLLSMRARGYSLVILRGDRRTIVQFRV